MVDMDAAFPSKYLKAADLQDSQIKARMSHVEMENVDRDGDKKPVLYFQKSTFKDDAAKKKGLVLNVTNKNAIKAAYGKDSENWRGKDVILFPMLVDFRGDQVEAIRVRVARPQQAPAEPPKQAENPADGFDDITDTF